MIYLDSAATSMLKPDKVHFAVVKAMGSMASPGRGAHRPAMQAADMCYECRENIAKLFNAEKPENVIFTFNATHALNIAINSLVEKGTKVLISGYEHNSVTRPLHSLGAEVTVIATPLFDPKAFLDEAKRLVPEADVVICTHVSNVFGYVLPVYELGRLCRKNGKPFIVDASQSAGVMDVDFRDLNADFMACPGHKGLMGPQGTGILICKNEAKPLLYGGSGSDSMSQNMPEFLPDRLEAGTHNVCGIAGLNEGVKYVLERGAENIRRHERKLLNVFAERLFRCDGIRLFYCGDERLQGGVLSLIPREMSCEAMGEKLSGEGIAVRSGLHCAPLAHESAGTLDTGTVRFSFSPFISAAQARTAAIITEKIVNFPCHKHKIVL